MKFTTHPQPTATADQAYTLAHSKLAWNGWHIPSDTIIKENLIQSI